MSDEIRKKLVFHIREESHGTNQLTPRAFHVKVKPKFPFTLQGVVTNMFFEMTEIYSNKWIYHRLKPQWIDYDVK